MTPSTRTALRNRRRPAGPRYPAFPADRRGGARTSGARLLATDLATLLGALLLAGVLILALAVLP